MPKTKILVVEDEFIVAEGIRVSLLQRGYEIPGVSASGEEAIEMAAQHRPDLVLMDIVLQGPIDGIDAARRIRAEMNIPVMYLTAYASDQILERAKATEPIGYIVKPFSARSLQATIEMGLHQYRMQQRQSESVVRTILEAAGDAILLVDSNGQIQVVNTQAERIFGYSREELLNQPIEILVPEPLRQVHVQHRARYQTEPRVRLMGMGLELKARRKDGSEFPVEISLGPINTPEGRHTVSVVRDVSEAQQLQAALKQSEEIFRQLAESIHEVFWLTNPEKTQMIYISRGYESIWGRPCEELYASPRSWMDAIHPEDQARVREAALTKQIRGDYDEVYRILRPDGSIRWIRDRAFPIRGPSGNVLRIAGLAEDVTEQRRNQAELLRAQRVESIGALASGIAHDLNNILGPILMAAEILRLNLTPEQIENSLRIVKANAQRGADLVRQLLTYARGIEGRRVAIQPRFLVNEIAHIIKETFPKNIVVRCLVPTEPWTVLVDPTQFHQVLLNLCVNARDAMPEGGTLSLAVKNIIIDETFASMTPTAKVGRYVVLEVADTGTGIPKEIQDRIFDPFFTTKAEGQGTGLGLSTVLGIVRSHGGTVQVDSEAGRGSIFKVFLPAQSDGSGQAKASQALEELPRGRGEVILIVDDEPHIREMLQNLLSAYGYQVLSAENGVQAIALFHQHADRIKVLLTDLDMPLLGGIHLIRAVRRMNPEVRIAVSSGLLSNGTRSGKGAGNSLEELQSLGVETFLSKPYGAGTLLTALHTLLRQR